MSVDKHECVYVGEVKGVQPKVSAHDLLDYGTATIVLD